MHPIISGKEILIPLKFGDRVTNAPKVNAPQFFAPLPQQALPVYVPQPAPARVAAPAPVVPVVPAFQQPALPAVPDGAVAPIDFWDVIGRLSWVDREDNVWPTVNPARPSLKWSFAEWQAVQQKARPHYDTLLGLLDREDFWHKNNIANEDQAKFIWHVIARGPQIYDAVKADPSFGCGYIGQDCGFIDFMRIWN